MLDFCAGIGACQLHPEEAWEFFKGGRLDVDRLRFEIYLEVLTSLISGEVPCTLSSFGDSGQVVPKGVPVGALIISTSPYLLFYNENLAPGWQQEVKEKVCEELRLQGLNSTYITVCQSRPPYLWHVWSDQSPPVGAPFTVSASPQGF